MKTITLFLMLAFCLTFAACGNKDAEVNAFISENSAVVKDIADKIEANPSAAGVDEAQKAFDAKKSDLKSKWDAMKEARGAQVSADVQKKLTDSMTSDMKLLTDASTKNAVKMASDPAAIDKFQKLMTDYTNTFK